ncbi:hypothetical protein WJN01_08650 [Flavobacteriaceae bacterium SZ-1-7]|uniref:hypothetical protein n=1 Tax=Tamlana sedimenti TaxID=3134126 RepID=UPI00312946D9
MKKLNLFFVALALIITSCTEDGDPIPQISGDIVGIWDMVDYTYTGQTVTTAQGQTLKSDFTGEAYNMNYTITFEENPNNLISMGSFSLKLTTTTLGQTSTQNIDNIEGLVTGTWEMVNGEIITNANGDQGKMKIEELTESSLVLSIAEKQDLSQSGVSIIADIDAVLFFERQ